MLEELESGDTFGDNKFTYLCHDWLGSEIGVSRDFWLMNFGV